MKIKTAIIGASGYTGSELLRLLHVHPLFDVKVATAYSKQGNELITLYPHLYSYQGMKFTGLESSSEAISSCELVFCGLPHGEAAPVLPKLENKVIIDLGSDFRLKNPADYLHWYNREHPLPQELPKWTYGLPELFREEIKQSTRIANPGCYATSIIVPLAPLLKSKLIKAEAIVSAYSGLSGGGREPKPAFHLPHAYEDVRAYKVAAHQHIPEIEQAINAYSGGKSRVLLIPHLVPMSRGIHATIVCPLSKDAVRDDFISCLKNAYSGEYFVKIVDGQPGTKEVRGTNFIACGVVVDERLSQVVITSVIDNLVKGAAGQAIQNANIVFGLNETLGLESLGLYP